MNNEQLKQEILKEVEKKYKIQSYRKTVESIVDIAINKIQEVK